MPDLNKYLSLSDLETFFQNARGADAVTEAWRTQYFKDLKRIVHPPLMAFFKALKAEGRMETIPNSEGYSCRFWDAWNDVARLSLDDVGKDGEEEKLNALAGTFAHKLTFAIVRPYERILESQGVEMAAALDKSIAYLEVTGRFSEGTYPPYEFSHENCRNTGLPLTLGFKEWTPFGNYIHAKRGFLPIQPLAPAQVQETVVELKTGNMLVADWFRIHEFTEAMREKSFSLDSRQGQEDQTRYLAEQFGVISVGVGNSMACIFQDGNQVIVGDFHEEDDPLPARFTEVGAVCTDLWAATLVEYETLIELVSRKLPDTAMQVVDDYVASHTGGRYGLHKVKLEPGTYYLYHFGDHELFAEMAEKAGIQLEAGAVKPYFVLTRTRLLKNQAA